MQLGCPAVVRGRRQRPVERSFGRDLHEHGCSPHPGADPPAAVEQALAPAPHRRAGAEVNEASEPFDEPGPVRPHGAVDDEQEPTRELEPAHLEVEPGRALGRLGETVHAPGAVQRLARAAVEVRAARVRSRDRIAHPQRQRPLLPGRQPVELDVGDENHRRPDERHGSSASMARAFAAGRDCLARCGATPPAPRRLAGQPGTSLGRPGMASVLVAAPAGAATVEAAAERELETRAGARRSRPGARAPARAGRS